MAHARSDGRSAAFKPLQRTNQKVHPNRQGALPILPRERTSLPGARNLFRLNAQTKRCVPIAGAPIASGLHVLASGAATSHLPPPSRPAPIPRSAAVPQVSRSNHHLPTFLEP